MSAPAVPKELGFHITTPDAVAARSYRLNISPYNNQTFKSLDVIKIKLPTNRNAFFDPKKSYLKFNVTCPATGAGTNPSSAFISFDGTAAAIINRLQSYSGGGSMLLESVEEYGRLYNLMMDLQVPSEQRAQGTYSVLQSTLGGRRCQGLGPGLTDQYAFGLISGVFGAQNTKMVPVGVLKDGIELHLYLSDFRNCFKAVTTIAGDTYSALTGDAGGTVLAANITITNVELVCEYCELNPNAMSAIASMNGNQYIVPNEQYRAISTTVAAGSTGTISLLVNHRFASVKNLWVGMFPSQHANNMVRTGISGRTKGNLASYQWRIGGINVPQKPVNCQYDSGAEAFAEVERCLRGMSSILGSCSLTKAQWGAQGAGTLTGAFAIGTELDVFDFTSDKPARSGVSTLDSPLYLDLTFPAGGVSEALNVVVYAHYDSTLIVDGANGQIMEIH